MRDQLFNLFLRWGFNCLGLWISSRLIPGVTIKEELSVFLLSGLVLALVNFLLKPVIVILSLPAIVLSLGLFIIFINGLMVYIASVLVGEFEVAGLGSAVLAGMIIGLVNYALTSLSEGKRFRRE